MTKLEYQQTQAIVELAGKLKRLVGAFKSNDPGFQKFPATDELVAELKRLMNENQQSD